MVNLLKPVLLLISFTLQLIQIQSHIVKRDAESKYVVMCAYHAHEKPYTLEDGRFSPEDIDPDLCTHIDYVFGKPDISAGIVPSDKYQDVDLDGYKRVNDLKTKNKNLKTLIAIGGTDEASIYMAELAKVPEKRVEWAKNLANFLKLRNFDGIIIRWQWPQDADRANHVALLKDFKDCFEKTSSPRYLIGTGLPDGVDDIDKGYDLPEINKYADFIIVMSYDYIFFKQRNLAHVAPLYSSTDPENDRYTVDYTIRHVLKKGADPQKVLVGIGTFGNRYTVDNTRDTTIGSPAKEHTYEIGRLAYSEVCEKLKYSKFWQIVRSKNLYSGPYAFRGKEWMSYDDPEMVEEKARYAKIKGLKGVSFCHFALDDFRGACHGIKYPLISAGKRILLDNGIKGPVSTPVNSPNANEKDKNANGCELPIKNIFKLEYDLICPDDDLTNRCKQTREGSLVSQHTTISYQCQKGYVLDSTEEMSSVCSKKKWSPALRQCKKTCRKLTPANMILRCEYKNKAVNCNGEMRPGTSIYPRCSPGYRTTLVPDYEKINCQDDGEWNDLLFKCVAVCGHISVSIKPLIHGGRDAQVGEFPWHVAIYDKTANYLLICGGTIISPQIVVSAAHCFADKITAEKRNPKDYVIAVGKYSREYNVSDSQFTKIYSIKRIHFNDYHGLQFRFENDIALLEIGIKITFSDFVLPACVHYQTETAPQLTSGQLLKTAGFGINEQGSLSPTLKVVSLPYLTTTECLKKATSGVTDFLSRDKFCAGNSTGEAVDQGDSGGGLMYQDPETSLYYLWGIVSFKATQVSPVAVFTNVQNHINWLLSVRNNAQKV